MDIGHLFLQPSADEHLDCSHFLAVMNSAACHIYMYVFSVLFHVHLEVELLGHRLHHFLRFLFSVQEYGAKWRYSPCCHAPGYKALSTEGWVWWLDVSPCLLLECDKDHSLPGKREEGEVTKEARPESEGPWRQFPLPPAVSSAPLLNLWSHPQPIQHCSFQKHQNMGQVANWVGAKGW